MKIKHIVLLLIVSVSIIIYAFRKNNPVENIYTPIKIGNQIWSKENLNVVVFRNGDSILNITDEDAWIKAGESKTPAWCYYNNADSNNKTFGKLYNWWAIIDPRGLAPNGWHIPTDSEWTILTEYLGGASKCGGKLKNTTGWNNGGQGDNSSMFGAMPGGSRNSLGEFKSQGTNAHFWTCTPVLKSGYSRGLSGGFLSVGHHNRNEVTTGLSVRLVKD